MVTGGNKVTIKTPLIATRYSFIISGLRCEVADVALIWRKKSWFFSNFGTFMYLSLRRPLSAKEKSMLFHP